MQICLVFGMALLFFMFVMSALFGVFAMRNFAGRILMKPLDIMSELDIGFHEFPTLGDTLILMLVRSSCMLEPLPDPGCNVAGDQLHKCVG